MPDSRRLLPVSLFLASLICQAPAARAQSALDRAPNLSGGWVGAPNSLYFNFLHRFNQSGVPQRQVTNRPTFLLAYRAPLPLLIGVNYATRSDVVARIPNEWEGFARFAWLEQDVQGIADMSTQLSWNHAAESIDGELSVARRLGPLRVLGAVRGFSNAFGADRARGAVAGGATLRVHQWVALAGDVATLLDREAADGEDIAWGAAVQIGIPFTPHTVSLQATNTNTATLHGASRGGSERRWGFEFTVPVTLARYFGERRGPLPPLPPVVTEEAPATPATDLDRVRALLADSITLALRREMADRARADSLARLAEQGNAEAIRLRTMREDSIRVAQQDSVRRAAAADSARRATALRAQQRAARPAVTARVSIRNMTYSPARIEITVGTTVIWRNNDQLEHTVTAADRSFDSGLIRPGASWQRTFNRPGTYEYVCTPHPFMKGTIVVRPAQ